MGLRVVRERAALWRDIQCQGPVAGSCPLCSKTSKENSGAGAQNMEERLGQVITKAILGVLFTEDFRMLFFFFACMEISIKGNCSWFCQSFLTL